MHGHADDIYILLGDGSRDHLRGLPKPGVNHFEACITQDPRDNPEPAIVAVQPDLCEENSDPAVIIH
jgi:hypothetical protein